MINSYPEKGQHLKMKTAHYRVTRNLLFSNKSNPEFFFLKSRKSGNLVKLISSSNCSLQPFDKDLMRSEGGSFDVYDF